MRPTWPRPANSAVHLRSSSPPPDHTQVHVGVLGRDRQRGVAAVLDPLRRAVEHLVGEVEREVRVGRLGGDVLDREAARQQVLGQHHDALHALGQEVRLLRVRDARRVGFDAGDSDRVGAERDGGAFEIFGERHDGFFFSLRSQVSLRRTCGPRFGTSTTPSWIVRGSGSGRSERRCGVPLDGRVVGAHRAHLHALAAARERGLLHHRHLRPHLAGLAPSASATATSPWSRRRPRSARDAR